MFILSPRKKADQGLIIGLGKFDRQTGGSRDRSDDCNPRSERFLRHLKGNSTAQKQNALPNGSWFASNSMSDQFVERVVPSDILSQKQ